MLLSLWNTPSGVLLVVQPILRDFIIFFHFIHVHDLLLICGS